jgi:putative membrane protein
MKFFLIGAGLLHVLFMLAELFPWRLPALLRTASKGLPKGERFTNAQQALVATIVHNAGIYNGIVAGGLFWAAFRETPANEVARVMLLGAFAAGIFGTATLKSPVTALQAVIGVIGWFLL